MGPRSRERGILRHRHHITPGIAELQWGRAHVSAEFGVRILYNDISWALQWGRAHVSAELRQELGQCEGASPASMGPRSRERGITMT